ncbi:TadE/TadG family type IV pilus assembly protein [Methylobacterium durans]|uniref:TadE/TadG family type IV pilus assembly protein n=1 Tax=Methylobacterium durans TaxID=2202825 RepID=UPI002AFEF452|nr:TadE/TadG family type IV pilus assembly protein [Methylobacterium durans]MEA1834043.1 TadE/TadG family type IV pilus assembly protein [Methylobacterium durans]
MPARSDARRWCREPRIAGAFRRFGACARGASAVEFALLAWPMIGLVLGILQYAVVQYAQVVLSDRLHLSASRPEAELLLGDRAGYRALLCAKIVVVPSATCQARLVVELAPLSASPTAQTPVRGASFSAGLPKEVMLLRAALPIPIVVPFVPAVTVQSSVVYRRT